MALVVIMNNWIKEIRHLYPFQFLPLKYHSYRNNFKYLSNNTKDKKNSIDGSAVCNNKFPDMVSHGLKRLWKTSMSWNSRGLWNKKSLRVTSLSTIRKNGKLTGEHSDEKSTLSLAMLFLFRFFEGVWILLVDWTCLSSKMIRPKPSAP